MSGAAMEISPWSSMYVKVAVIFGESMAICGPSTDRHLACSLCQSIHGCTAMLTNMDDQGLSCAWWGEKKKFLCLRLEHSLQLTSNTSLAMLNFNLESSSMSLFSTSLSPYTRPASCSHRRTKSIGVFTHSVVENRMPWRIGTCMHNFT